MLKLMFVGAISFLFMALPVDGASYWYGISSSEYNTSCGSTGGETPQNALNGVGRWRHNVNFWHWVDLDLGAIYDVTHVRGRSSDADDPIDVSVYVTETYGVWGDPVLTGIADWQDTTTWATHSITPYARGRYLRFITFNTEDFQNWLGWGKLIGAFTILDVHVNDDPEYPPDIPHITNPKDGDNLTDSFYINWTETGDPNNETYNASVYIANMDGTINVTVADNNITNGTLYAWVNISSVFAGTYRINVTLCDFHEPFDACSSNLTDWNFTIVNQPPTVTIDSPVNQTYNTTDMWGALINLSITSDDPELDDLTYWYSIDGGANVTITGGWEYQEYGDSTAFYPTSPGDYDTWGELYVNYTIPPNIDYRNSSFWMVKHGFLDAYNVTFPHWCWDYSNTLQLRFLTRQVAIIYPPFERFSYGQCYNGTWNNITLLENATGQLFTTDNEYPPGNWSDGDWGTFSSHMGDASNNKWTTNDWCVPTCSLTESKVYEEAVYWNIGYNLTTFNLSVGFHTLIVYANDTSGNVASDMVNFTIHLIPIFNISFVSPTPGDALEIGFDTSVLINMSFNNNSEVSWINIDWDGTNYTLTDLGGYAEYNPSVSAGTVYNYRGYINTTLGYVNTTEARSLIVSTFTQSELDSRFTLDDLMLLLLFIFVGILVYVLIKI